MTGSFCFISLPVQELWQPSAAFAALTPIVKRNNLNPTLIDVNLELHCVLGKEDWDSMVDWCSYVRSNLPEHIRSRFLDLIDEHINVSSCDWLAISVFSFYSARPTALMLQHLRSRTKKCKILLGGNGCMSSLSDFDQKAFGEYCLDHKLCDHVIFGEGELSLDRLLQNQLPFPGVDNKDFEQIDNLDHLPLPDYSGLDFKRYKDPRILITGSRGCVRHCTFCDVELTWPKYAYRSPHLIVEEIKRHVNDIGICNFQFTDSLINGSVSNFNRFNELLINAKANDPVMAGVNYTGMFICRNRSNMHSSSYELMYHAGCRHLAVGIEHFSERVRYHMKKKFSDSDIDYHLEMSSRWGIANTLLMIVGYPTETLFDHQQQIKALHRYQIYNKTGAIYMIRWGLTMHIYENTPLTRMNDELQIQFTESAFHDSFFNWVAGSNPGLDLRERLRRRLELHELSRDMGYSMPHSRKELTSLQKLAQGAVSPTPSNNRILTIMSIKSQHHGTAA